MGTGPEAEWGLLHTEMNGKIVRERIVSEQGNYNDYYDGVAAAIRDNKPLPVTAEEALNVIKIIEAAYKSNQTNCIVEL